MGSSDRAIQAVPAGRLPALVRSIGTVDAVVLTPLRRTGQTLDLLVRGGLRLPPVVLVEPALVEQDFGRWEEGAYQALATDDPAYWPFWNDPVGGVPPGGESFRQLARRAAAAHRRLAARLEGQVLHVGHAGPIRALLRDPTGDDLAAALARDVPPLSLHRMQAG